MATTNQHQQAGLGTAGQEVPHPAAGDDARPMAARLTSGQVWHGLGKASFAVLGYVTPSGEPRSSGVVYKTIGRRLYVAVAPDSWKARHIAASGRVGVTVPGGRGGGLSLVAHTPPAPVNFHATAILHPAGSPQVRSRLQELGSLLPAERRTAACVIEILPEGAFLTYALGVPLRRLRDPAAARGRVPVTQEGRTR